MMTTWQTRLILTGLVLVFAGFVFSLAFSLTVDHQPRLVAHEAYEPVFVQIGADVATEAWQSSATAISRVSIAHRRATDVHGHATNMGIVLMLMGLLSPLLVVGRSGWSTVDRGLLSGLAVFSVVYPLGLFLQFLRFTTAGEIVAALGAAGAIACLVGLYVRLWKGVDRLAG